MRNRTPGLILTVLLLLLILSLACPLPAFAAATGQFSVDSSGNISMGGGTTEAGETPTLSYVLPRYRQVLTAGLAILAITMGVIMTVMITKLGAAGDNPMRRHRAVVGIATAGIAAALLGGLSIYTAILWNLLAAV